MSIIYQLSFSQYQENLKDNLDTYFNHQIIDTTYLKKDIILITPIKNGKIHGKHVWYLNKNDQYIEYAENGKLVKNAEYISKGETLYKDSLDVDQQIYIHKYEKKSQYDKYSIIFIPFILKEDIVDLIMKKHE